MRTFIAGLSVSDYYKKYRKSNKNRLSLNEKNLLARPGTVKMRRAKGRRHYINNCEFEKARNKKYKSSLAGKITQWKSGAKRRGIFWNVTRDEIEKLPLVCHYTGLELTVDTGENNTLSIDRLDSSRGYVSGNIVPCCAPINKMKLALSVEDFINWCVLVAKFRSPNVVLNATVRE